FLEGKDDRINQQLKKQMETAAAGLEFERAALYRDQLQAVERVTQRQKLSSTLRGDVDLIGLALAADLACAQVFFIRQGKLLGKEAFFMEGSRDEKPAEIMSGFLKQFYGATPNIPPLILLQDAVEEAPSIASWLRERRQGEVKLQVPLRGEKKQLVDLVVKNAKEALEHYRIKQLAPAEALTSALAELEKAIHLPHPPNRVECYDISNIQGQWAVGSLVVFEGGRPKPSHYRRFRIRTVLGADDYAMLQEVLRRRFKHSDGFSGESPWAVLPDLILIDGGKGQLNAALEVVRQAGLEALPVASIAKEEEEIYLPQTAEPIKLPAGPALYLVQRIRDEAHRFAIGYHIKVRRKSSFASALDQVPGIGPRRKRALMRAFGSVRGIKEAREDAIAALPGLTLKLAQKLKQFLG
ncbi:MAG: excinuclease ABC subunit UvrC, partial [Chloroflexota bacterium]